MDRQRLRRTAPRRQLLMAASVADDGPWCTVRQVEGVEVITADPESVVKIEVRDPTRFGAPPEYIVKGCTTKPVNVPHGEMRAVRVRGSEPLTIYALGGL